MVERQIKREAGRDVAGKGEGFSEELKLERCC